MFLTLYGGDAVLTDREARGPFEDLVIRAARVVGGSAALGRVIAFRGSDGGWLEVGNERSGVTNVSPYEGHSHLRVHSPQRDLMVRLLSEDADDTPAPAAGERGPYLALTIGPHELRADGQLLADRASPTVSWVTREATATRGKTFTSKTSTSGRDVGSVVLAVRSAAVAVGGEVSHVTPGDVVANIAPASTPASAPASAPEATPRPEFKFIERVRVDPKIYRARGTPEERDP